MKTTSSRRVQKLRVEATKRGRRRREYYATPAEHDVLVSTLAQLRQQGQTHENHQHAAVPPDGQSTGPAY